jgi:hypothetical protein
LARGANREEVAAILERIISWEIDFCL